MEREQTLKRTSKETFESNREDQLYLLATNYPTVDELFEVTKKNWIGGSRSLSSILDGARPLGELEVGCSGYVDEPEVKRPGKPGAPKGKKHGPRRNMNSKIMKELRQAA